MARQRIIVGIGEALLAELPEREEPAGLAVNIAVQAARLGHLGVPISRLGQDAAGQLLIRTLSEMQFSLELAHLQNDPDLPTGRMIVRSIGDRRRQTPDGETAFDNLQWDFDLEDVAQRADAVVFGMLAQRSGQARSVIERFLNACSRAIRVVDLGNRADGLERRQALSALRYAQGAVIDEAALTALVPAMSGGAPSDAVEGLLRGHSLAFVAWLEPGREAMLRTVDNVWTESGFDAPGARDAAIVGLLHGMLCGWPMEQCLHAAVQAARHPAQPVSEAELRGD